MKLKKRTSIVRIALPVTAAVVLTLSGWIVFHHSGAGPFSVKALKRENSFEYDLSAVSSVDTSLIGYREKSVIPIPVDYPSGICINALDQVFVAGSGGVFLVDGGGSIVGTFKSDEWIRFCAVDEKGKVYAGSSRKLWRYGPTGTLEKSWNACNDSSILTSAAIDDDNIYIGDAGMKTVWRLDSSWRVLNRIGSKKRTLAVPGFILPSPHLDIAVGQEGSLWATNSGRHTIENYRPNGDFISSWGAAGTGVREFCGCCNPIRMAILPDGSFVTGEKGIVRVKLYNQAGQFVCVVAPPSAFHTIGEGLDLAADSHGNIAVLIAQEKKIKIYEKKHT